MCINFFNFYFQVKYVGNEVEKRSLQMEGLNLMDKTLYVQGARISFCIWDVAGTFLIHFLCFIILHFYIFIIFLFCCYSNFELVFDGKIIMR
jgi:hypothetical protein